jgi:superfamily I DNA/RNA helicase
MAFNKHIAREQAQLVPDNVKATTCHSQGFSNFRDRYPKARFDGRKFWRHFRSYKQNLTIDAEFVAVDENAGAIAKLVSLCKGSLLEPTNENLNGICDHFGVNLLNGSFGTTAYVFDAVRSIFKSTVADVDTLDYDDMVYFSAANLVPCEKFDFVVVDECQDLNQGQIQMVFNSLKAGGRILATGDAYQSMYGFRGADAQAVQNIIDAMTDEAGAPPTILPLDVTYRCPTSVVEMVNGRFPHISFNAAPNAKTGTIAEIGYDILFETAKTDDLVLCRTNAPLVEVCYALIRRGKKAAIRGRDIGKGLIDLLTKVQKRAAVYTLADVLEELVDYGDNEVGKLVKAKKFSRAAQIQDQVATIIAVSDGCFTVQDVKTRIDDIFTDDEIGIICSSIHRAKGDESETVFIIEPHLMPHPMAEQDWELIQESNIEYVCLTRTKDRLFFVV